MSGTDDRQAEREAIRRLLGLRRDMERLADETTQALAWLNKRIDRLEKEER